MKKLNKALLLSFLFLTSTGCNGETNKIVDSVEESKVDAKQWGYEFSYNSIENPFSMNTITTNQDKKLYIKQNVTVEESMGSIISIYDLETDTLEIMNNDPSKLCSIDNPTKCSGYFEVPLTMLNYYNGSLYYLVDSYDVDTEKRFYEIYEMDVDGTNRKKVFTLEYLSTNMMAYNFHKGYMYYSNAGILGKVNIENWEQEIILEQEKVSFTGMLFDEDNMYINAYAYQDENDDFYPRVLLEIDLSSKEVEPIYAFENDIMWVNQQYIVEFLDTGLFSINRETGDKVLLSENMAFILMSGDRIILSEDGVEDRCYILADLDGNKYDRIVSKGYSVFAELFNGEYLYTTKFKSDEDGLITETKLVRFSIKDDTFQEEEILLTVTN